MGEGVAPLAPAPNHLQEVAAPGEAGPEAHTLGRSDLRAVGRALGPQGAGCRNHLEVMTDDGDRRKAGPSNSHWFQIWPRV